MQAGLAGLLELHMEINGSEKGFLGIQREERDEREGREKGEEREGVLFFNFFKFKIKLI